MGDLNPIYPSVFQWVRKISQLKKTIDPKFEPNIRYHAAVVNEINFQSYLAQSQDFSEHRLKQYEKDTLHGNCAESIFQVV